MDIVRKTQKEHDLVQQYNQDTKSMSRSDRNNYYQQKTKEDGWFQK